MALAECCIPKAAVVVDVVAPANGIQDIHRSSRKAFPRPLPLGAARSTTSCISTAMSFTAPSCAVRATPIFTPGKRRHSTAMAHMAARPVKHWTHNTEAGGGAG